MPDGASPPRPCRRPAPVLAPAPPVARLVVGQTPDAAAELLPRIFNLCRAAQAAALRLAFGLPLAGTAPAELRAEILRDHLARLHLVWPRRLGLPAMPMPAADDRPAAALFGPAGAPPATAADWQGFLAGGQGVAPVLAGIAAAFPGDAADAGVLPGWRPEVALDPGAACENSVAGRRAAEPSLVALAALSGRGPLWRAAARAVDAAACAAGQLEPPRLLAPGVAAVPAARGTYTVSARVEAGRIAAFARVTPTDHLAAPGGVLARAFAALPEAADAPAGLLIDILDPCVPVLPMEAAHA